MTMTKQVYELIWKGQRSGPFTRDQILQKIDSGELGLLHQAITPNGICSLKELLADELQLARRHGKRPVAPPIPSENHRRIHETLGSREHQQVPPFPPQSTAFPSKGDHLPEEASNSPSDFRISLPPRSEEQQWSSSGGGTRHEHGIISPSIFQPLVRSEVWIRTLGIVTLTGGILNLLGALAGALVTFGIGAIGVIPSAVIIWLGIIALECAAELRRAKENDSIDSMAGALDRIGMFFKVAGIFLLITAILALVFVGIFLFLIAIGVKASQAN
jgi:hypothetical protein